MREPTTFVLCAQRVCLHRIANPRSVAAHSILQLRCESEMIVVASSGLNIPPDLVKDCEIAETPNSITIDGQSYDVRGFGSLEEAIALLKRSKAPPHMLGSSAPQYVSLFGALSSRARAMLVVTGTRKFLGTYHAAIAAARTTQGIRKSLQIKVLDSGLIELGAGLIALYCAAAARSRPDDDLALIYDAGQALSGAATQLCAPATRTAMEWSKGADLPRMVLSQGDPRIPIIGMKEGDFQLVGMRDPGRPLADEILALLLPRYPRNTALWVAISYCECREAAQELLASLRRYYDIRYAMVCSMTIAGYLLVGSGGIGLCVAPIGAAKLPVKLPESR